jgi:hypothetical protein
VALDDDGDDEGGGVGFTFFLSFVFGSKTENGLSVLSFVEATKEFDAVPSHHYVNREGSYVHN